MISLTNLLELPLLYQNEKEFTRPCSLHEKRIQKGSLSNMIKDSEVYMINDSEGFAVCMIKDSEWFAVCM